MLCQLSALGANRRPASYSEAELGKIWHPVGKSKKKMITSNSAHYWAWSSNESERYLGAYLGFEGIVIGDPHPRNVADYRRGTDVSLAVVDIDDGGKAPLILDFARYITYLEASKIDLKIRDVFQSYLDGLNRREAKLPAFLHEAFRTDSKEILDSHLKWLKKHIDNNKFIYSELEIESISTLSPSLKSEAESLKKIVINESRFSTVFDIAYRVNDSGSSAGQDRFWFLVGNAEPERVIEMKALGRAAVDFFEPQQKTSARVQDILEFYTKSGFLEMQVVQNGNNFYWMRPRHFQLIDLDDKDFTDIDLAALSLYVANWLGKNQAKQSAGKKLAAKINEDVEKSKQVLEVFVRAYLKEANRLSKSF